MVCHYDMIRVIICNQKFLFTSKFWKILGWFLGAKCKLSTAFHSQIDKQIEKQNRIFKHYLRVYCNYKQNNWSKFLFITMFTYNNNVHSSINQFFHQLLKNYIVILAHVLKNIIESETSMIMKRVEWLRTSKKYFMNMWKKIANT